ncbi:MAG: phosphate/phosphite/phosphonate ABC transporter substrate-binding protein [Deltaproteobacteria bacterium]|nr:phosphate/phosphite/phosphonate ABC transporter substrate-binding protein [Deltaproteobacteria bacterium]
MTIRFAAGPIMHGPRRAVVREIFADALGAAAGEFVEVVALPDYDALGEAVGSGAVDFAWLPPAVYVSQESRGISLLLACARVAGAQYRACLFVRQDSSLREAKDLWGARVAWVHQNSAAGYLFPRMELRIQGLKPDEVFAEQKLLGSHGAVVQAVALAESDVGATYLTVDARGRPVRWGWEAEVDLDRMRSILMTEPIPSDVICASPGIARERQDAMSKALMAMHDVAQGSRALMAFFGAQRLEPTLPSHYDGVRAAFHK